MATKKNKKTTAKKAPVKKTVAPKPVVKRTSYSSVTHWRQKHMLAIVVAVLLGLTFLLLLVTYFNS